MYGFTLEPTIFLRFKALDKVETAIPNVLDASFTPEYSAINSPSLVYCNTGFF